jgi:GT2 family glycosyltransferase
MPAAPQLSAAAAPAVSVVVPTWQRRASVLRLCAALAHQTLPPERYEVIVSVDGSEDGTREALSATMPPYALASLWQPNRGRAAALNAGIRVARGDLLVFLDDDMEPSPALLQAHLRAHEGGSLRGVMGAVPVRLDDAAPPASRYIGGKFNGHLENLRRPGYTLRLTDFYSGNFSIRREVLQQAGGFDEDFRAYGNEDLELSLRLRAAGVTLVYEPAALAVQHNDKDFRALARDSLAEGRTAVQLARKHPEAFAQLKLGTFGEGPRSLRLLRAALLAGSRRWPTLPDALVRLERTLARAGLEGEPFYRLALGYFYWLGARAELAEQGGRATAGLERLARELRA